MIQETNDFFIDGVYAGTAGDEDVDEMLEKMRPEGDEWRQEMSSLGGYSGYRLYFNEREMRARVVGWKTNSGYTDKNGCALYNGDEAEDECGNRGTIDRRTGDYDYRENRFRDIKYVFSYNRPNNPYNTSLTLTPETARKLTRIGSRKMYRR